MLEEYLGEWHASVGRSAITAPGSCCANGPADHSLPAARPHPAAPQYSTPLYAAHSAPAVSMSSTTQPPRSELTHPRTYAEREI